MTAATGHDIRTTKRADELSAGDRIAAGFLPTGEPADVLFVRPYRLGDEEWVLVAYQVHGARPDSDNFRAAGVIWLDRQAPSDRTLGMPSASAVPNTITEVRFPVRRFPQNGGPR